MAQSLGKSAGKSALSTPPYSVSIAAHDDEDRE